MNFCILNHLSCEMYVSVHRYQRTNNADGGHKCPPNTPYDTINQKTIV